MKMMNTELAFVAFDAQDVIATSGGLTEYYGITSNSLGMISYTKFGNASWILDTNYTSIDKGFVKGFNFDLYGTLESSGETEYVLTGAYAETNRSYFTYTEKSQVNLAPGAQNLYDSNAKPTIKEVLDWLVTNQSLLQ